MKEILDPWALAILAPNDFKLDVIIIEKFKRPVSSILRFSDIVGLRFGRLAWPKTPLQRNVY